MNPAEAQPEAPAQPPTDPPPPERPRGKLSVFLTWLFIFVLAASLVWWLADFGAERPPERAPGTVSGPAADPAQRARIRKAENQYQLGVVAAERGDREEAMLLFAEAAQLNPKHPQANASLGILLQEQGLYSEALERLRRDLEINPDAPRTHYFLGLCYGKMSEPAEAIAEYRLAVRGAPQFVPARFNLGVSLMLLGRNDEAVEEFEETLKVLSELPPSETRTDRRATTLKNLADVLIRRGKLAEAAVRVEEALSENPDLAGAISLRGEIALAGNRPDQARADFAKALALNPNDERTRKLLAELGPGPQEPTPATDQATAESLAELVAHLQEVVQSKPEDAAARNDLGLALIRTGQHDQAREQLEEAVRLAPTNLKSIFNLAGLYQSQGELEVAERSYRQALELDPAHIETHRRLVLVLASAGRNGEAVAAAAAGLEQSPEDTFLLREQAWMLATVAEQELRDGPLALSAALHLRELWERAGSPVRRGPRVLDILAAAYAENARFDEAVAAAERAAQMARETGKLRQAKVIEDRIQLYRRGRPYHLEP